MAGGLLLVAFVATRAGGVWLAGHPEHYRGGLTTTVTYDPTLYENWANQVYRDGRAPYGDVKIEYPPGSLPFMILPMVKSAGHAYLPRFIALMLAVDVVGMAGLVVIARRARSWWGPWAWALLIPMLGPIAYNRLDMVPAVAIIWSLERAQARGWFGAGGWLGFGAVAKIYPGVLVPVLLAARWRWRWRILAGAVLVAVLGVLPVAGSLPGLWHSVVGYHTQRGLQIESTWGIALLATGHLGHTVQAVLDHGSWNTAGSGASMLKSASLVASIAVLAAGIWLAANRLTQGPSGPLSGITGPSGPLSGITGPSGVTDPIAGPAVVMFATLALVFAVGTVFSPQFMILLSALGAVSASVAGRQVRVPLVLLGVANVLSQVVYPFHYDGLLANHALPVATVALRNALVVFIGLGLFVKLWRGRFAEPEAIATSPEPVAAGVEAAAGS
ncbi:MAG TPA: glycosyltransferase 87 family protein [Acidimicrobiales bacterium]|nr:glycosyltransferase 87 family protein [Acidimicrobiales bacterium]